MAKNGLFFWKVHGPDSKLYQLSIQYTAQQYYFAIMSSFCYSATQSVLTAKDLWFSRAEGVLIGLYDAVLKLWKQICSFLTATYLVLFSVKSLQT